jgi:hypothetical protein
MLKIVLVGTSAFWASFVAGSCVSSASPDPSAWKAAQTEIELFQSFLRQPLCEQVAVKYQLAGDYAAHCFLMGSLNEKKIVRYAQDGTVDDFVPSGRDGLAEVLGIRMDPKDTSVWVASGLDAQNAGPAKSITIKMVSF